MIVHDGGENLTQHLEELATGYPAEKIRCVSYPSGLSLGELRNHSVENAAGEYLCQWDDDDLFHPERLKVQFKKMRADRCDFSFMTDQLHLYEKIGHIYWEDWSRNQPPNSWIHGTILGASERYPRYPGLARGEDSGLVDRLVANRERISLLSGCGYLYIYTYNGLNAWDLRHHMSISQANRKGEADLLGQADTLRIKLREYALPYSRLSLPHERGVLEINL